MIIAKMIVLIVAVAAILAYIIGTPSTFSAEYTSRTQSSQSANDCGNTNFPSDYESLVEETATYCANTDSEIQGEENVVGATSSQR